MRANSILIGRFAAEETATRQMPASVVEMTVTTVTVGSAIK